MQGWEGAIYTLSVQRPQPFRIVLFYIQMLKTDRITHLLNFSLYRTVPEENIWLHYSDNVDMIEYDNI